MITYSSTKGRIFRISVFEHPIERSPCSILFLISTSVHYFRGMVFMTSDLYTQKMICYPIGFQIIFAFTRALFHSPMLISLHFLVPAAIGRIVSAPASSSITRVCTVDSRISLPAQMKSAQVRKKPEMRKTFFPAIILPAMKLKSKEFAISHCLPCVKEKKIVTK